MSEPMKKPLTKNKERLLNMKYKGDLYRIPRRVANKYKVDSASKKNTYIKSDSLLADDLFAELDSKYSKPGALLQGLRHREGLSQQKVAALIQVTQSDLSKMENGKRPMGKTIAKRIADRFDVDYRIFM